MNYIYGSIFRFLPDEQKKSLLNIGRPLEFMERKCLFQRGDPGDGFYIIRKGDVTITLHSQKGEEIILNRLSDGEAFGEIAMLDNGVRTADAVVEKGTSLIHISQERFGAFLEKNPSLYPALIGLLCGRLRWCSDLVEDLLFHDCYRRLVSRLVTLSMKYNNMTDSLIEVSQEDLAKMLRTSREVVNRNLQLLQEKGLVSVQRKRILIPDVLRLKNAIGGE